MVRSGYIFKIMLTKSTDTMGVECERKTTVKPTSKVFDLSIWKKEVLVSWDGEDCEESRLREGEDQECSWDT